MSIRRYVSSKDNTISSAFKVNLSSRGTLSNMGASDILEVFSIFGQASSSSVEQSRILIQFPVDKILADRQAGKFPASGSVNFKLKMFNAEHNQTVPEQVTCVVRPLVKAWSEGPGLDMETFLDESASNWISASSGVQWTNQGGDFLSASYIASSPVPMSYKQYLETGLENIDIDVTPIVEEFLYNQAGNSTPASGSVVFSMDNPPSIGEKIKIYAFNGDYNIFQFSNVTGSSGKTHFVKVAGNASQTAKNFIDTINVSSSIKDYVAVTGTDNDLTASLTQRTATFYGNTIISSSAAANVATVTSFAGGTGALNYGFVLKLSGSLEDGSLLRSYYTKKFFAKSSHHFLERPIVEAQWDSSVKDDRGSILKSSSLAPAADNLNNIYLYNRIRGYLQDIPSTGSHLLLNLVPSLGSDPESLVGSGGAVETHVTASRHSKGIYKATFAYSGSQTSLRDIWLSDNRLAQGTFTYTGTVADLNNGVTFTIIDASGTSHVYTFDTSGDTHTVSGQNSTIGVQTAKSGTDTTLIASQVNASINASTFFTSTVSGSVVTINQKLPGTVGDRTSAQSAGNVGYTVTNLAVPSSSRYTQLVTGSGFAVTSEDVNNYYEIPQYLTKITNLKSSYGSHEHATFRVYTRNKNWKPNLYTVATNTAPVNNIRDAYYKVSRVADNLSVISYSTGSARSYSSLSYDVSGSYFDLDISILEPNYLYEISFLYKDGSDFIEQKEKFKFRVDP